MQYIIVGLGNPGVQYEETRHNMGRIIVEAFRVKNNFSDWSLDKEQKVLTSRGLYGKDKIILLLPNNFMNVSGKSIASFIKNSKDAERTIVVYDDLDLALGILRISFNRGSGGHKGVESIIKEIRTPAFIRLRMGITPTTPGGKLKKPTSDTAVIDFIIGQFKKEDLVILKKVTKGGVEALTLILDSGYEKAMGIVNSGGNKKNKKYPLTPS